MRNRHLSVERIKNFVVKDLGNKAHIFVIINYTFVRYSDAAAFLSSVLESKQAIITSVCRVNCAVAEYAEYSALFVQTFFCKIIERKFQGATIRLIKITIQSLIHIS